MPDSISGYQLVKVVHVADLKCCKFKKKIDMQLFLPKFPKELKKVNE